MKTMPVIRSFERSRVRLLGWVWISVWAVATTACVSVPLPPRGVSVDDLDLTAEPIAEVSEVFPEARRYQQVLEIRSEPDTATVRVVSTRGVVWLDGTGRIARAELFEDVGDGLYPARSATTADGQLVYVGSIPEEFNVPGVVGGRGRVVILDQAGRHRSEMPSNYASDFLFTGAEVFVESVSDDRFDVFDLEGRRLRGIPVGMPITRAFPIDLDGDGDVEIAVYGYPVGDASEVRLLDGETGRLLDSWASPVLSGFTSGTTSGGEPGYLALVGEELRVYSFGGFDLRVLETLPFPYGDRFAGFDSLLLPDRRRVTLVSGGSGLRGHTLTIHGADGRLLYQRVEKGRAQGLAAVATDEGTTVYYGVGGTVWVLRGV